VPMELSVRETLSGLCEGLSDDDFVFMNSQTGPQLTDVKHGFRSSCRDAEVFNLTFHDLRHTFGTRLADAGVDIVKIAELMGHQLNPDNTAVYTRKRAAIVQLASYRRENCHKCATTENAGDFIANRISCFCLGKVVSRAGLEPATHWLKASCSTN
jgi:hypothetical protein